MSKLPRVGLLAGLVLGIAGSSSRAVDQKAIDKAIDRGVAALRDMQTEEGVWPNAEIGATALAGLTLLECGTKADDKAVLRAADAVRQASITLTHSYSICLAILFLDRLGDPGDVPSIESLTVRLLAGQTSTGGWTYRCPPISDSEARRLKGNVAMRRELVVRREPRKGDAPRRTAKDLPPEIQQQIALINRGGGGLAFEMGSDNSNTQFATLALWIARRHGLPVEKALKRVELRFRSTQHPDGGWGYFDPNMRAAGRMAHSTASMTCAGLLGLAVGDGNANEALRQRKPDAKSARDINKDPRVRKGLLALSTTIGQARENVGRRSAAPPSLPQVGGRTYYFLWSLERVAVALDLKTIGKKDWYTWGAEILVANQQANGVWLGHYAECGADTCFALLFLKRANLVPDLTTELAGRVKDPGERVLKNGALVEGIALDKSGDLRSGIESKNAKPNMDGQYPAEITKIKEAREVAKAKEAPSTAGKNKEAAASAGALPVPPPPDKAPPAKTAADKSSPVAGMATDLVKSTGSGYDLRLKTYREGKGPIFTEALALAIPQLKEDRRRKVEEALVERLTHMKDTTLANYLEDEQLEIRVAAACASAAKGSKALIPRLIPLVRETRGGVAEAAHRALKELSGQDFGPKSDAGRDERVQAARDWLAWWQKQQGK